MKSIKVPHGLIALSRIQQAVTREVGAPLYLPAFQSQILEAEARREDEDDDLDFGVAAGGFTLGDEDDDFY